MLEGILYSLVWIVANVAYSSMVGTGDRGFRRFAAFLLGWPGTLVSYFVVKPTGRVAEPKADARYQAQLEFEEERDLLLEIRRDRALRVSRAQGEGVGRSQRSRRYARTDGRQPGRVLDDRAARQPLLGLSGRARTAGALVGDGGGAGCGGALPARACAHPFRERSDAHTALGVRSAGGACARPPSDHPLNRQGRLDQAHRGLGVTLSSPLLPTRGWRARSRASSGCRRSTR